MKSLFRCSALLLMSLAFVSFGYAQQPENLTTVDQLSAQLGANRSAVENLSPTERLVHVNMVTEEARHCQKYMKRKGHKILFFGHVTETIDTEACANDASTLYYTHTDHNLRTTAGGDWQASVMGNTAAQPASCNYIAVSNDATAPAAGDTSVAGEIVSNGLSRAQGVYAHTASTASFTIQKVFSATGTQASQKTGLLNASSSGTLCFENTYTGVTVNNGDTLTVTWTINY